MPKTKASTKAKTAKPKAAPGPERTAVTRVSTAQTKSYKNILSRSLRNDLTLGALFAELIGTFGLTAILLSTNGNAIVAGIAVLIFVMVFSKVSGGHVNPAATFALLVTRKISAMKAAGYILAQVLGAMLALVMIAQFVHTAPAVPPTTDPYTGQQVQSAAPTVFTVADLGQGSWRPFFAEALGAVIFGLGVAGANLVRRENSLEQGFIIGGALMLGLLLATQASGAILNPAAAIGLGAYKLENWWTVGVYAIAPLLGAAVGALLFKVLKMDADTSAEQTA